MRVRGARCEGRERGGQSGSEQPPFVALFSIVGSSDAHYNYGSSVAGWGALRRGRSARTPRREHGHAFWSLIEHRIIGRVVSSCCAPTARGGGSPWSEITDGGIGGPGRSVRIRVRTRKQQSARGRGKGGVSWWCMMCLSLSSPRRKCYYYHNHHVSCAGRAGGLAHFEQAPANGRVAPPYLSTLFVAVFHGLSFAH